MSNLLVYKPKKSLIIPRNEKVLDTIPKSKAFEYKGKNLTQVYHGENEVIKLREMGIDAPSPIMSYYEWPLVKNKFKPYEHQKLTAAFLTTHPWSICLNPMGMMKTESTLYAADHLINSGVIKKVLVLAPLSCIQKVWGDAVFSSFPWQNYVIVHGSKDKRIKALEEKVQFYVANHEFVRVAVEKYEVNESFRYRLNKEFDMIKDFDAIIVDEYSVFRNGQTYNYKALETILRETKPKYFWALTGTPCPTAPTDAWALARLINPDNVDKWFGSFQRKVMMQISNGPFPKWVPRPGSHEIVSEVLQPAIRFKKEDCLDLPPLTFQNRECDLTKEQKAHFKSMRKEMVMLHDQGDITAVNAADRLVKLRQILCGSIKANEDDYAAIDCKPRINLMLELIEEAGYKVIIVAPYKGILRMLKKEIGKHYTCEIINGDVPQNKRNEIFTNFQEAKDPHVLLCHPKVMSYGLTLTAANYIIMYAPIDSNDLYGQLIERINRPGQVNNMSIVHVAAHPIEWRIYEALKSKKSFQSMALELYHEEFDD